MKNTISTFLILFVSISAYCQNQQSSSNLNFDFEKSEKGKPVGWSNFGADNYTLSLDSTHAKSEKYCAVIELNKGTKSDYKAWEFKIPNNYAGKKITLSGYIKTENVTDGFAGLWMRIDPSIGFDNMQKRGIKGTTDWTEYEITLAMNPEKTKQIVVGGLLVGQGKVYFDNFKVTVDGKDIKDLQPFERKIGAAEKDKEFDKGSGITSITADKTQIDNLKSLGLIWGFIKYYHPNVAKGDFNMDYELFRILPKVLSAETKKTRDDILVAWINGLGSFTEGKEPKLDPTDIKLMPDVEWIKTSNFSNELSALLIKIKTAERPSDHYYIDFYPGVGNPEFKNENSYSSMKYPDAGFRLLAIYRYWNMIQYFFPYKNLIEEDWKNVLAEFIPKFVNATNETDYTLAALEIIGRIHDTHANIYGDNKALNDYLGINYSAVEVTFIENKAVVTGYYNEPFGKATGLEVGDIITSVNKKTVDDIVNEKLKYTPASNYPTALRNIARNLLRSNDSTINIEYLRNEKKENKNIKTFSKNEINLYSKIQSKDTCFKFINKDIAYINHGALKTKYLSKIAKEMENTKGLIIDDRNYPSDFPIYDLSNYLMPESTPYVKFTSGSKETPGLFTFGKSINVGKKNKSYYKGKVIILVNEISQSSAEFHAMAYRVHPNATVIGSTTAGADGNVSKLNIPGGISSMISGIGVYYPDGKETQRIGIVPNIEVKPTINSIKAGKDELMEKAIEIINKP